MIAAEVVYCGPSRHWLRAVRVPAGSTLRDAVIASGLLAEVGELSLESLDLGVFNVPRAADAPLCDGDRVEIYRPLLIDPKEARRVRADLRRRGLKSAG
jgi:putative ubiquitin-RnfH superfamily antitoxin RatB of RatAB toxin-antitoxin module